MNNKRKGIIVILVKPVTVSLLIIEHFTVVCHNLILFAAVNGINYVFRCTRTRLTIYLCKREPYQLMKMTWFSPFENDPTLFITITLILVYQNKNKFGACLLYALNCNHTRLSFCIHDTIQTHLQFNIRIINLQFGIE